MSTDPWGGGSDRDPELRLREQAKIKKGWKRFHPAALLNNEKLLICVFVVIAILTIARIAKHGW